jgi:pilus assembly protein Flp/PilA
VIRVFKSLKGPGKLRDPCTHDVKEPFGITARRDPKTRDFPVQLLKRFAKDESGATAIEYCLIAAGIALVIIPAVKGLGSTLNTKFSSINSQLR